MLVILLVRGIDVSVLFALCFAWILLEGCALYLDISEDHSGPQPGSMQCLQRYCCLNCCLHMLLVHHGCCETVLYVRRDASSHRESWSLHFGGSEDHPGPQCATVPGLQMLWCLSASRGSPGCCRERVCTINADPSVVALSSELDRGAIGHEPDRGVLCACVCSIRCLCLSAWCDRLCASIECSGCSESARASRVRGI